MDVTFPCKQEADRARGALKQVQAWLTRRPPSKALDTAWEMRRTVDLIANALATLAAGRSTVPDEIANDLHKLITDHLARPAKPHLLKRACRETGVDYDALIDDFDAVTLWCNLPAMQHNDGGPRREDRGVRAQGGGGHREDQGARAQGGHREDRGA